MTEFSELWTPEKQRETNRRYRENYPDRTKESCRKYRQSENGKRKRRIAAQAQKAKKAVWNKLYRAILTSKIERPSACQICGKEAGTLHGHHRDYLKPLEVIWACPKCHNDIRLGENHVQ